MYNIKAAATEGNNDPSVYIYIYIVFVIYMFIFNNSVLPVKVVAYKITVNCLEL